MAPIEDQITELWGEITAATHRFLTLIAEFDRSKGWMGVGMTSCAQWLNLHCGIGEVAAREKLRVAHALAALPRIDAAFRDGQVSYSKARAMTRVATPDNEAILLNIAEHGTASHVERTVRQFRRFERIEAAECAADQQVEPDEPDHSFDRFARRRAEGLKLMAEQFLAEAAAPSGCSGDRYQVVVHIDQQLLSDQPADGQCEIEDGPALAVETAKRLACDGSLIGIVEDADGTPLDIGRKTRAIPPSIKRALKAREGGFGVQPAADAAAAATRQRDFLFTRPDGLPLVEAIPVEKCFRGNILPDRNRERGIVVDPETIDSRWLGERMDYSLAIDALIAAGVQSGEQNQGQQQ
jgi:hypothetical protein